MQFCYFSLQNYAFFLSWQKEIIDKLSTIIFFHIQPADGKNINIKVG